MENCKIYKWLLLKVGEKEKRKFDNTITRKWKLFKAFKCVDK